MFVRQLGTIVLINLSRHSSSLFLLLDFKIGKNYVNLYHNLFLVWNLRSIMHRYDLTFLYISKTTYLTLYTNVWISIQRVLKWGSLINTRHTLEPRFKLPLSLLFAFSLLLSLSLSLSLMVIFIVYFQGYIDYKIGM